MNSQEQFDIEEYAAIQLQGTPINHEHQEMHERRVHIVYLVTYRNAKMQHFDL